MAGKAKPKLVRPGPIGGKRDENRRQRVRVLEAAALDLFLRQGIEGTTIDDIVDRAAVAKGSFYRYFADKEAIVRGLFEPVRSGLVEVLARGVDALNAAKNQEELLGVYQQLAFASSALLFAHREAVLLYLQESRSPPLGARTPIGELADLLRRSAYDLTLAAREHALLREMNARVTSLAVLGSIEALLFDFLSARDPVGDPVSIAQTLISMVLDGMRNR